MVISRTIFPEFNCSVGLLKLCKYILRFQLLAQTWLRHTALNLLLTDDSTLPESRALAACLSVVIVKLKGSAIFSLYVSRQSNSSLILVSDQWFVSWVCLGIVTSCCIIFSDFMPQRTTKVEKPSKRLWIWVCVLSSGWWFEGMLEPQWGGYIWWKVNILGSNLSIMWRSRLSANGNGNSQRRHMGFGYSPTQHHLSWF